MRSTYISEDLQQIEFARKAGEHFANHPEHTTFTDGEIEPDAFLAIRWGMDNDCVLVTQLHSYHEPTIYAQAVKKAGAL